MHEELGQGRQHEVKTIRVVDGRGSCSEPAGHLDCVVALHPAGRYCFQELQLMWTMENLNCTACSFSQPICLLHLIQSGDAQYSCF